MIQNTSLTMILALFLIFIYVLKEYIRNNFETESNKKIMNQVDLLFIFPAFISIIFFSVILMQHDIDIQNKLLIAWIEVLIFLFSPFILIMFVAFIKNVLEVFFPKNKNEHNTGEHIDKK